MEVKLKILILVTGWMLLNVTGCSPQTGSVTPILQVTSEIVEGEGQDAVMDNHEPMAPSPTDLPTLSPTQTPPVGASPPAMQSTLENELEAEVENELLSITSMPTEVIALNGYLYFRTSAGIARFSLQTEEIEDLMIKSDKDRLVFDLSPDRQQLAYGLYTEGRFELWVTKLTQWSPELIFTVSGTEQGLAPDTAPEWWGGLWWVDNQYLVFVPGYEGYDDWGVSLFIPVRSYLVNVPRQNVEIETGSLTFGCSLAVSPQSNQVATWCPAIEGWSDPRVYFRHQPAYYVVLEGNGEYWRSGSAPTDILVEFRGLPEQLWSWSPKGEYAAFSIYDEVARVRTLYYIDRQGQSLIAVEENPSHGWDWSPDQRYISFVGSCPPRSCNKVFDRESQQIVWTSRGLPGVPNATYLNWSYDSNYIVVLSEGITIIDVVTGERIRNFKDLSGGIIVWSP
jgi:hypothetical protein